MRISKIFLPDVNVSLALASGRHIHSQTCADWLNSIISAEIAFCRVAQMGLLRLLTNESVMGKDVLSSRAAGRTYRTMIQDERISFHQEPFDLEDEWRKSTSKDVPIPKICIDAYLASFAKLTDMRLVSLDRGVLSLASDALVLR